MRFSTTRFFTDQFLRSYRMSRLKELLLLACRMALFALLAMALAQPLFMPKGAAVAGRRAGRARSCWCSTTPPAWATSRTATDACWTRRGRRRDRARRPAARRHGRGRPGRPAGRRAGSAVPRADGASSTTCQQARRPAAGRDRWAPTCRRAVARAEELARAARRRRARRSTSSATCRRPAGTSRRRHRAGMRRDVSFFFVRVRPKARRQPRPSRPCSTPRPGRWSACRSPSGRCWRWRGDDGKDVEVRLYVDGDKVGEQKVEQLPGGRWAVPRFHHTFTDRRLARRLRRGRRRRPAARTTAATSPLKCPRRPDVKVLAVNGAPSRRAAAGRTVLPALALTASPGGTRAAVPRRQAVGPAELAEADLGKYPLVVLANVERCPRHAVEKLEDYVDDGGSLLVFLGDKVNAAFYNAALAGANRRNGGLLPASSRRVQGEAEPVGFISRDQLRPPRPGRLPGAPARLAAGAVADVQGAARSRPRPPPC